MLAVGNVAMITDGGTEEGSVGVDSWIGLEGTARRGQGPNKVRVDSFRGVGGEGSVCVRCGAGSAVDQQVAGRRGAPPPPPQGDGERGPGTWCRGGRWSAW